MTAALFVLSVPNGKFVADLQPGLSGSPITFNYRLGMWPFVSLMFVLGCAIGIGKASVYKHIPDYFPNDVAGLSGCSAPSGFLPATRVRRTGTLERCSADGFPGSPWLDRLEPAVA